MSEDDTIELERTPVSSVTFDDATGEVTLSNGEVVYGYHSSKQCPTEYCTVHNPSNHQYSDFELGYFDGVFTRLTSKGKYGFVVDPDDPAHVVGQRIIMRNSVFCNICENTIVSTHLNDEQRCECDMGSFVSVNGGKQFLKRVRSAQADYDDTSIVFNL